MSSGTDFGLFLSDCGEAAALELSDAPGNVERVQLPHPEILESVSVGARLLLPPDVGR